MNSIYKKLIVASAFFVPVLLFVSCGEEEVKIEQKSMTEIREEDGLPVEVKTLQPQMFEKNISYFSSLHGIKESTKGAAVADRIRKINAKVGDYVKEGQVIVEFPTDNPNMQYEQAKVGFENTKKTYDRMKGLLEAGEISQQQFDNTETQYLVAKRNFEQVKEVLMVEAPISGRIVKLHHKEGDIPKMGDPLFTVAQTNQMISKIDVSDDEILNFKLGQQATAEWQDYSFNGRVSEIALATEARTNAFPVEIQFNNPENKLKSGMSITVKVKIYENPDALVVQRNLVQTDSEGEF
ncbi:MAG: efflux RND transporter periplasmic adaptor subunit, partial [Candidatus Kapaibacterium sp.]